MIAINMDKPKSCIDCPCFDFENEICQVHYILNGGLNISQSANNVLDTMSDDERYATCPLITFDDEQHIIPQKENACVIVFHWRVAYLNNILDFCRPYVFDKNIQYSYQMVQKFIKTGIVPKEVYKDIVKRSSAVGKFIDFMPKYQFGDIDDIKMGSYEDLKVHNLKVMPPQDAF